MRRQTGWRGCFIHGASSKKVLMCSYLRIKPACCLNLVPAPSWWTNEVVIAAKLKFTFLAQSSVFPTDYSKQKESCLLSNIHMMSWRHFCTMAALYRKSLGLIRVHGTDSLGELTTHFVRVTQFQRFSFLPKPCKNSSWMKRCYKPLTQREVALSLGLFVSPLLLSNQPTRWVSVWVSLISPDVCQPFWGGC